MAKLTEQILEVPESMSSEFRDMRDEIAAKTTDLQELEAQL